MALRLPMGSSSGKLRIARSTSLRTKACIAKSWASSAITTAYKFQVTVFCPFSLETLYCSDGQRYLESCLPIFNINIYRVLNQYFWLSFSYDPCHLLRLMLRLSKLGARVARVEQHGRVPRVVSHKAPSNRIGTPPALKACRRAQPLPVVARPPRPPWWR